MTDNFCSEISTICQALHDFLTFSRQLTDGYWADWAKVPEGEHLALNECMFNFSVKNMLRCSYGKYFRDDTNVKRMSKSYHLVRIKLPIFFMCIISPVFCQGFQKGRVSI